MQSGAVLLFFPRAVIKRNVKRLLRKMLETRKTLKVTYSARSVAYNGALIKQNTYRLRGLEGTSLHFARLYVDIIELVSAK